MHLRLACCFFCYLRFAKLTYIHLGIVNIIMYIEIHFPSISIVRLSQIPAQPLVKKWQKGIRSLGLVAWELSLPGEYTVRTFISNFCSSPLFS